MPSHTHKHPLSGVARWTVPAALCSVGMMGAWLAPGASAMASTPAASTHAANPAVVIHSPVKTPSAKAVLAYWTPARDRRFRRRCDRTSNGGGDAGAAARTPTRSRTSRRAGRPSRSA